MRPTHLSRLRLGSGDLEDIALLHCEWALGLGRFAELRDQRLHAGIPIDCKPEDLLGDHGNCWELRFTIPQADGTSQTSAVRLSRPQGELLIEHLVVRSGPSARLLHPTAATPEVVERLLQFDGIEPSPLRASTLFDSEIEPEVLVSIALDPAREVPLVLVSVDNATGKPLVDPAELATRLRGMMRVAYVPTVWASRRVTEALVARNLPHLFGCYNGGVRILRPRISASDDPYEHLLLLPVRLSKVPEAKRSEHAAGVLCETWADEEDLRGWLRDGEGGAGRKDPGKPRLGTRRGDVRGDGVPIPRSRDSSAPVFLRLEPEAERPVALKGEEAEPTRKRVAEPKLASEPVAAPPRIAAREPEPVVAASPRIAAREPEPAAAPMKAPAVAARADRSGAATAATANARAEGLTFALAEVSSPASTPMPLPPQPVVTQPAAQAFAQPVVEPRFKAPEPEPEPAEEDSGTPSAAAGVVSQWSQLAGDVVAALELAQELEADLNDTRQELIETRKALRRAEQERDEADESKQMLRTVADAVRLVEARFSDRMLVLPSALASSRNSPYRDAERVFRTLTLLALFGRQDREFENALLTVMGAQARWKPKDGPETLKRFGGERTWTNHTGERQVFGRHVTVGHGVDAKKCLQIYYDIIGDGRIEVAWVGEHRPTVSEDT